MIKEVWDDLELSDRELGKELLGLEKDVHAKIKEEGLELKGGGGEGAEEHNGPSPVPAKLDPPSVVSVVSAKPKKRRRSRDKKKTTPTLTPHSTPEPVGLTSDPPILEPVAKVPGKRFEESPPITPSLVTPTLAQFVPLLQGRSMQSRWLPIVSPRFIVPRQGSCTQTRCLPRVSMR
jgi:hypothetical protein